MSSSLAPRTGLFAEAARSFRQRGLRTAAAIALHYLNARWQLRRVSHVGRSRVVGKVRVRNDHGSIVIGDRVLLDGSMVPIALSAAHAPLTIGDGAFINYATTISARSGVTIGNNVAIGQYSIIMDNDEHATEDHRSPGKTAAVVIEDDVWLGARVIVLRGAHIGRGAVIGANSVVTGAIPAYSLAVGSPARVVRSTRPVG